MQMIIKRLYDEVKNIKNKSQTCPSCQTPLPKEPKRKITCKACKEPIFVIPSIVHRKTILMNHKQMAVYQNFLGYFNRVKTKHCPLKTDTGLIFPTADMCSDFDCTGVRLDTDRAWGYVIFESNIALCQKDLTALLYFKWQEFFILFMEHLFDDALLRIPTILTLSSVAGTGSAEQIITPYEIVQQWFSEKNLSVVNMMAINALVTDLHEFGMYFFSCQDDYFLHSLEIGNTTKPDVMTWFVEQCIKYDYVFYKE